MHSTIEGFNIIVRAAEPGITSTGVTAARSVTLHLKHEQSIVFLSGNQPARLPVSLPITGFFLPFSRSIYYYSACTAHSISDNFLPCSFYCVKYFETNHLLVEKLLFKSQISQ